MLVISSRLNAQCDKPVLIDDVNISNISSPYQLTFLHEVPQNQLDELVNDLMNSFDSLDCVRLVDAIGALKTPESYCLLYSSCCRPLVINDLNPFNGLVGKISMYGAYRVLNKYYLDGKVFNDPDNWRFATNVILECKKREPACYYCPPPDYKAEEIKELEKIDTRKYDKIIIDVIKKYSDLKRFGGIAGHSQAMDSIVQKLYDYEFVGEAIWDKCSEKIAIYPSQNILGVIIMIDEKPVEKCYNIQVGEINRITKKANDVLIYKKNYLKPGFNYDETNKCNPE